MGITISDLQYQSVAIQGAVHISYFDEGEHVLLESQDIEFEWGSISEEWADWPITYIFALDGVLRIELEKED